MRDSRTRTAAQSATVLTHTTHFISHFSFRKNPSPSLHDIALTGHRRVVHIPHCHHVRFRLTCREPCGCSESRYCLPMATAAGRTALSKSSRQENIHQPSHPQQLPTPLRSGNEPHCWP